MPDRAAGVDRVRAGRPLRVGSVTLLPVERVVVRAGPGPLGAAWVFAAREPYALIVRDADGVHALAVGAAEISLEQLRERIPELDAVLPPPSGAPKA